MDQSRKLHDALTDIVTGRGVKRAKHELVLNGKPVVDEFIKCLEQNGFRKTTVGEIEVQVGERVPAFYIDKTTTYFGWVFWEKFTDQKARKLWGSVIRNDKGDWAIQLPPTKPTTIHADVNQKLDMDADKPIYL